MRSPDQRAASTRFAVDTQALSAAAAQLDRLAAELSGAIAGSRGPALDAVGAVPPSDLFNALAFCWGRWSRMVQDTQPALHSLAERPPSVGPQLLRRREPARRRQGGALT